MIDGCQQEQPRAEESPSKTLVHVYSKNDPPTSHLVADLKPVLTSDAVSVTEGQGNGAKKYLKEYSGLFCWKGNHFNHVNRMKISIKYLPDSIELFLYMATM